MPQPHKLAEVRRLPLPLPTPKLSDAQLAEAAAGGDPSAQGEAWNRYAGLVRGMLRRSLGPWGDVEDPLQEVFIRFFRNLHTLRDPEAVRSFLIGITLRVASGELRRRRVRRWLRLTDTGVVPEQATEVDEDAREALERLYAILDQQSDDARLAFVLRHVEGMELTEVAQALGVSLATVKRKLARVKPRIFSAVAKDPVLSIYADIVSQRRPR